MAAPGSDAAAAHVITDSAQTTASSVWHGAQDVAGFALGLIGVNYRFGGTTPESGLDCSGLIQYVFQHVTGVTLPRTSREMSRLGEKVSMADLNAGDLVFFNTRKFAFSHVGLYLGGDRFIHAPRKGGEVEIVSISAGYWQKHFNGARRVIGVLPSLVPLLIPTADAATFDIDAVDRSVPPSVANPTFTNDRSKRSGDLNE